MPKRAVNENLARRITLLGVLAALALMASAQGCKSEPEEAKKVETIRFWHTFNEAETATVVTLLDEFQRAHPELHVEVTVLSFGSGRNRLLESMRGGSAPDLARAEVAWIPEFASLGLIEEVSSEVQLEDHVPSIQPFVRWKDKTWAWPQSVDCLALFYNASQLEAIGESPPANLDDLIRIGSRLTIDDQGRHALSPDFDQARIVRHGLFLKGDGYTFLPFLWAHGGGTVDVTSREVLIDGPASSASARYLSDLRQRYNIAPAQTDFSRDYEDELRRFGEGKVSMIINGPWASAEILGRPAFAKPGNLGIAPVPRGPSGEGGSPVGGHGYVIPKGNKSAAVQTLARFLSGREAQLRFASKNHILPTLQEVYKDPSLENREMLEAFQRALAQSHERAVFPGMARLFDALTPALQQILRREVEPEVAFGTVGEEWKTILESKTTK